MTTTVEVRTPNATTSTVTQAYAYAFDPTPEQANLLRSHIGGSRFCYNTLLGLVKNNWDENRATRSRRTTTSPPRTSTCFTSGRLTVTMRLRGGVRTELPPTTTPRSV